LQEIEKIGTIGKSVPDKFDELAFTIVADRAEGEEVRARIKHLARSLLGRHVSYSADHAAGVGQVQGSRIGGCGFGRRRHGGSRNLGQTKVAAHRNEYISRFDRSVRARGNLSIQCGPKTEPIETCDGLAARGYFPRRLETHSLLATRPHPLGTIRDYCSGGEGSLEKLEFQAEPQGSARQRVRACLESQLRAFYRTDSERRRW
jgi:hypothetical protein